MYIKLTIHVNKLVSKNITLLFLCLTINSYKCLIHININNWHIFCNELGNFF